MDAELQDRRVGRVGAWMGIVFVVFFVAGFLIFPTPSDYKDAAKWDKWWTDSGHRIAAIIGAYLIVLGALAFVWFMWNLTQRFRDRAGIVITFGSLFVALVLVSTLIRAAIPGGKQFGSLPVQSGGWSAQLDNVGFGLLLVSGALSAGAFTAAASYLAHRAATLPTWLTIAGYVVAILQLGGALFFPFVLFPIWVLVVSIVLLVRDSHTPKSQPGSLLA